MIARVCFVFTLFWLIGDVALGAEPATPKPVKKDDSVKDNAKADLSDDEVPEPAASVQKDDGRRPALTASMMLKVVNPNDVAVLIKKEATALDGFMTYQDEGRIVIKLPPSALSALMLFSAKQGYVIEKSLGREELSQEIAELEGRLKSKTEILNRLRSFFTDSDANATLDIERNMTELVMEIETVKGRLRVLNDRADWAVVNIAFQFRERDRVVYVRSPFEWLNTANLDTFLQEF